MNRIAIIVLLILAISIAGCSNAVVGRVGDRELKQADLDKRIAIFKLFSPTMDASAIDRADLVDQLLEEQMLVADAEQRNIKADPEEVEPALDEIEGELQQQFPGGKIDKALKKFNLSLEDLKNIIEDRSKIQQLFNAVTDDVTVTEEDVARYYEDHKDDFMVPQQVKASHILVKEEELANGLMERLQKGEDFAELAREYSEDASGEAGGDLGYFPSGRMVAEFDQAAFSTPVGELSQVIKTQFGYHIIKVEDKKEAHTSSLEEVKAFLAVQLENQQKNDRFLAYIDQLKQDTNPQNLLNTDEKS